MLALGRLLELTLGEREPAEKIQLCHDGTRLQWKAEGVLLITPPAGRDGGSDLLLSAGIHGNETAPVELLERLLHRIARGQLRPACRLLLVLGNPLALRRGERYVQHDLNRLFGGAHEAVSALESLRAAQLEQQVLGFFADDSRSRLHLDLHTALRASRIEQFALRPCSPQPVAPGLLALLHAAGIGALLQNNRPAATFSAFTATRCAADALTLELGLARPFGNNPPAALARVQASLEALIEARALPAAEGPSLQHFRIADELIRLSPSFRLHLADDLPNFAELEAGSLLAEDAEGRCWRVEQANARIVFPNPRVAVGQRAGLIVVPA